MATIVPEHDEIKKAVKWVSETLEQNPDQPVHTIIKKTVFEFNLSPLNTKFLMRFFQNRPKKN